MRNKLVSCFFCILTLFYGISSLTINSCAYTADEVQNLIGGIVEYQLNSSGKNSVQDWIDDDLSESAGISSEWYIFALSQSGAGYNFKAYENSLKAYLDSSNTVSAVSRQKYALALISAGSCDKYISGVLENSIGMQGIMSWIYGLHLLNNGYTSSKYTVWDITDKLISMQLSDGGWALSGSISDVDVTAMAVQALAPYYSSYTAEIESSLSLLSQRQLEDGGYSSYGVPNPESAAQVMTALSALGIDSLNDQRFIKNGKTLIDGILEYRLADGSYSHTKGGAYNYMATVQVFYSLTSYTRYKNGCGSIYILDNRNPSGLAVAVQNPDPSSSVHTSVPEPLNPGQPQQNNAEEPQYTSASEASHSETSAASDVTQTSVSGTSSSTETVGTTAKPGAESAPETTKSKKTELTANTRTDTEETANPADKSSDNKSSGYKPWAILIISGAGVIVCFILLITKKRNIKSYIAVGLAVGAGIIFVLVTDFQSTDNYYNSELSDKADIAGTVEMTIRCDKAAEKSDSEYIPENGVILDVTEFPISEGETVFELLTDAARAYEIQMEYSGSPGMAYVTGINYLYEFDFGDLSGWVYFVNGESPSVGCGEYVLNDGDTVEWHYTCDLGNDIESGQIKNDSED